MILKASQRSGGKQLGVHLMRTDENEHVEVHEVRGFVSGSILGAMQEAYALSRGTRCSQYLFSVSLNPPETENVRIETFESALAAIEERLGLSGQPRVVVFHEKEGRRHAHAVWSRIDAETMTARPLSFFKTKLQDISRQLFLENGWKMPRGLVDRGNGDPKSFSLAEWQQSKRTGNDPKLTNELVQQCWAASDNRASFEGALEERGLYLARGDQRGRVIVSYDGTVLSLSRALGRKEREMTAKIGNTASLRSVGETLAHIKSEIAPRLSELIRIAKRNSSLSLKPLLEQRNAMSARHRDERAKLDSGQQKRWDQEVRERASRLRSGLAGMWDRLSGARSKAVARNELEALNSMRRDRLQRDGIVLDQLNERRELQQRIKSKRREGAALVLSLLVDHARFAGKAASIKGGARASFSRGASPRGQSRKPTGPDFGLG